MQTQHSNGIDEQATHLAEVQQGIRQLKHAHEFQLSDIRDHIEVEAKASTDRLESIEQAHASKLAALQTAYNQSLQDHSIEKHELNGQLAQKTQEVQDLGEYHQKHIDNLNSSQLQIKSDRDALLVRSGSRRGQLVLHQPSRMCSHSGCT